MSPSSVLFPLPDGPITATNWRDGTSKLMSRMISTWCAPLRIVLTRFRTAIMFSILHEPVRMQAEHGVVQRIGDKI